MVPDVNDPNDGKGKENYYSKQQGRLKSVKTLLGKYAVSKYLLGSDSIVIDAGTSLSPIAEAISNMKETSYTIMTHNYEAFNILKGSLGAGNLKGLNLFFTGGRYNEDLNAFFGDQTCNAYQSFGPKKVFIGLTGVSWTSGLRCRGNTEEKQVKEIITKLPAEHKIVMADFIKFGKVDALKFADIHDLQVSHAPPIEPTLNNTLNQANLSIITNKPDEISYRAHIIWLKEQFNITKWDPVPYYHDLERIYNTEVESLEKLQIDVDAVDLRYGTDGDKEIKYTAGEEKDIIAKYHELELPEYLVTSKGKE